MEAGLKRLEPFNSQSKPFRPRASALRVVAGRGASYRGKQAIEFLADGRGHCDGFVRIDVPALKSNSPRGGVNFPSQEKAATQSCW